MSGHTGGTPLRDVSADLRWSDSGKAHTPPKIKVTEQQVAYNPFFMDLAVERPRLDPSWASQPGIILNWLLKEEKALGPKGVAGHPGHQSLILGVEATSARAMKDFLDKFCRGHGLTDQQVAGLVMLGHPTLACKISNGMVAVTSGDTRRFVQDVENYSGVLGGELHYGWKFLHGKTWYINYNSGRYGPQHLKKADGREMKSTAKRLFKEYCGVTVRD